MTDYKPKILVVDDDPGLRGTLAEILEDEGYDVCAVDDGYQAIDLAGKHHYVLIFMDTQMPGIDGFTTCRKIVDIDPKAKVIFLTGLEVEDCVRRSLESGAYSVLTKPADPEDLLFLLNSVVGPGESAAEGLAPHAMTLD